MELTNLAHVTNFVNQAALHMATNTANHIKTNVCANFLKFLKLQFDPEGLTPLDQYKIAKARAYKIAQAGAQLFR